MAYSIQDSSTFMYIRNTQICITRTVDQLWNVQQCKYIRMSTQPRMVRHLNNSTVHNDSLFITTSLWAQMQPHTQ